MIGEQHIGREVRVKAADDFYAFIDGRTGTVQSFESGHAMIRCQSEEFDDVDLFFVVPPDQLELA